MIYLTRAEAEQLERVANSDDQTKDAYIIERGPLSGHAFADNGFGMVADLTAGQDVDADGVDEADSVVAEGWGS